MFRVDFQANILWQGKGLAKSEPHITCTLVSHAPWSEDERAKSPLKAVDCVWQIKDLGGVCRLGWDLSPCQAGQAQKSRKDKHFGSHQHLSSSLP